MLKKLSTLLVVTGVSLGADPSLASPAVAVVANQDAKPDAGESTTTPRPERSNLSKAEGIVMLDYEVIPVPDGPSIDLLGFHFLNKMNDWMYLGIGGFAPLFRGEYGGFTAFDVTAHVQRKIFRNFFADAGVSLGGGGGGKSVQQSKVLSGTGGFVKTYVGLGYDFTDLSVGANFARMKFTSSTIDHAQFNIYVQIPFSYTIGSYASSGDGVSAADGPDARGSFQATEENTLTLGLDNFKQINPKGSYKGTVNVTDLQFSHFMTKSSYWYFNVGVGYHGLPLYNQLLGGLGYRIPISSRFDLHGQLGLGSGGYAPEKIDTGSGLLVYPKLSAEYMLDRNFGLALSAGYLYAPKGSSKNYAFGASLNYHIHSGGGNAGANDRAEGSSYRGYRFSLFQQTEFGVKFRDLARSNVKMLSLQLDNVISDQVYIPVQASVAYNAYLGYPGYGELLIGAGLQNKYHKDDRFQFFGQLLVGTNVHGAVLKPGIGLNYGVSDRLAIYGLAGQTYGIDKDKFRASYAAVGLTYRFSVPSW